VTRPRMRTIGLQRLRDETPRGLCPFCLDKIPATRGPGRKKTTCGTEECVTAEDKRRQRDRRRSIRGIVEAAWDFLGPPDASWRPSDGCTS
jgi:hypothetical protein